MAHDVVAVGATMQFTVTRRTIRRHGQKPGPLEISLNLPGLHNVRNALAAICVATELGVSDAAIVKALAEFKGVGRRFTKYGEINIPEQKGATFTLIDDYGHHPVEMAATLAAARGAFPNKRLVLAFQPHRYTRTRDCFGDFVKVLHQFDALVLTEVYPAGEPKISGADSQSLIDALRVSMQNGHNDCLQADQIVLEKDVKLMASTILNHVQAGDVVITMGAGSISTVPQQIVQATSTRGAND
jgi:UDP-N-acetylmuramate--alanine ligase